MKIILKFLFIFICGFMSNGILAKNINIYPLGVYYYKSPFDKQGDKSTKFEVALAFKTPGTNVINFAPDKTLNSIKVTVDGTVIDPSDVFFSKPFMHGKLESGGRFQLAYKGDSIKKNKSIIIEGYAIVYLGNKETGIKQSEKVDLEYDKYFSISNTKFQILKVKDNVNAIALVSADNFENTSDISFIDDKGNELLENTSTTITETNSAGKEVLIKVFYLKKPTRFARVLARVDTNVGTLTKIPFKFNFTAPY